MTDLDAASERILRILEAEGRITNLELARRAGLSPSACLRRVQEMERSGVIAGYRARIDPAARGIGFVAYVAVGLSRHSAEAQRRFERACAASPAVRECHNITGTVEYLLRIEARDLPAYKQFHNDVLGEFPFIGTITTHVVLASPKDDRA